ncbi:MAG: methyl-accepting chemotaxis protein [Phycisphaerales bacterium]|nr:methyl-accepting chemotaxis protein [Phycisphaerales bacterium]
MSKIRTVLALCSLLLLCFTAVADDRSPNSSYSSLKAGNARYSAGESNHPNISSERFTQAGSENQGDHAIATVITCSDSRVPVELLFDAGVMDLFVIRVAGNVCDTDEIGSIEYGLAHVNTPLLVVLGHTQCGAVTAVTNAETGHPHQLERNIPPLIDNIKPAVRRALDSCSGCDTDTVVEHAIQENVWQSIEDLFQDSPVTRNLVNEGKVKVVGAIYNVGTGQVEWLDESPVASILAKVESNPYRATNVFFASASDNHSSSSHGTSGSDRNTHVSKAGAHGAAAVTPLEVISNNTLQTLEAKIKTAESATVSDWVNLQSPEQSNTLFWALILFSFASVVGVILWDRLGYLNKMPVSLKLYCGISILLLLTLSIGFESFFFQSKLTHYGEVVRLQSEAELAVERAARHENEYIFSVLSDPDKARAYYSEFEHELQVLDESINSMRAEGIESDVEQLVSQFSSTVTEYQGTLESIRMQYDEIYSLLEQTSSESKSLQLHIEELLEQEHIAHSKFIDQGADPALLAESLELISALELVELSWLRVLNGQFNYIITDDVELVHDIEQDLGKMIIAVQSARATLEHVNPALHDIVRLEKTLAEADHDVYSFRDKFAKIVNDKLIIKELIAISHHEFVDLETALEAMLHHSHENMHIAEASAHRISILLISMAMVIGALVGYVMSKSIVGPVREMLASLETLVTGDLSQRITVNRTDEFGKLGIAYNTATDNLAHMMGDIRTEANEVADLALEISNNSMQMTEGINEQRLQTSQVSAAVEEMSASVSEVAQSAQEASSVSDEAGEKASYGGSVVQGTIGGMNAISNQVNQSVISVSELGKKSEQVGEIAKVINDIADQTNLLALNAAIEAARAGEHGRGFAVVADEVRKLAERTAVATQEVAESVQAIKIDTQKAIVLMESGKDSVHDGVQLAEQAGSALEEIVDNANNMTPMIQGIAAAATQQSAAANEISRSIERIDMVTNESAQGIGEVAHSAETLTSKSVSLQQLVAQFTM